MLNIKGFLFKRTVLRLGFRRDIYRTVLPYFDNASQGATIALNRMRQHEGNANSEV